MRCGHLGKHSKACIAFDRPELQFPAHPDPAIARSTAVGQLQIGLKPIAAGEDLERNASRGGACKWIDVHRAACRAHGEIIVDFFGERGTRWRRSTERAHRPGGSAQDDQSALASPFTEMLMIQGGEGMV